MANPDFEIILPVGISFYTFQALGYIMDVYRGEIFAIHKYISLLITFSVSGLRHGAQWSYVAWGLLNGMYQVVGDMLGPIREIIIRLLNLNKF